MANTTVDIPDFDFASFYYPQILEALIQFKRLNVPELTDESEFEPFIQLLRAFALVGHLNNTLTDLVANESTLPTARLVETVRNMLKLIDFDLSPATPSQVEIVYELSRVFATSVEIVPLEARAATQRSGEEPVISFEANAALTIPRTDELGAALSEEAGVFTDRITDLNDPLPGADFSPWVTPAVGDAMYFGHLGIMWNKLDMEVPIAAVGITGVWEFYDGDFLKAAPDVVTPGGSTLVVELNGLLGSTSREGTSIRVTLNETGAFDDAVSQWNGSENFVVVDLLGQTTPSTDVDDYTVGSDWTIIDDVTDGTAGLTGDGVVEYSIPQSVSKNWAQTAIEGITAFWLRFRIVVAVTPTSPTLRTADPSTGKQYVIRLATQGLSASDDPLGSSTGLADQRHETSRDNFISDSEEVTVDGEVWTSVDNFLNSAPTDKHYVVELGEDDRATIVFGSGNQGAIPPIGSNNISVSYRFGAQDDGNVGPDTVTVDKQGLTFINSLFNPRQASGWQEADGSDEASLERVKITGPNSLRVKAVALGPDDVEELATTFKDDFGSRLYTRALAIEEGLGPKTIQLVVVIRGGGQATTEQLDALDDFFNGDKFSTPPLPKRIVANQEVTSFNFTERAIDITATVTTTVTAQQITNRLQQIIQPEALKDDGVTFEWEFGSEVPRSRIIHEIFETDESTTKVVLTSPAADVPLGALELPVAGTITLTIVAP